MRRTFVLGLVFAAVVVVAPVAADTPDGDGPYCPVKICHATYKSTGASAWFQSYDSTSGITTDIFVSADRGSYRTQTERIRGPIARITMARVRLDDEGFETWISITTGEASGRNLIFSIAPRLAGATLRATMFLTTCVPPEDEPVCTTASTPTVLEMSWTATGLPVYQQSHSRARTAALDVTTHFDGTTRVAAASGRLGSMTFKNVAEAGIEKIKSRSLIVNRRA